MSFRNSQLVVSARPPSFAFIRLYSFPNIWAPQIYIFSVAFPFSFNSPLTERAGTTQLLNFSVVPRFVRHSPSNASAKLVISKIIFSLFIFNSILKFWCNLRYTCNSILCTIPTDKHDILY